MSRIFWSLFFLCVPLGAVAVYAACGHVPGLQTATLPANYSPTGERIDQLYWLIHGICAVILVGTGLVLAAAILRFGARSSSRAKHIHGSLKLEIAWTILPAGILVWLALHQMHAWAENKLVRPKAEMNGVQVDKPPLARITAKQFGWEILYAGADGRLDTPDDLYVENELHLPVDEAVVLELRSRDVIHSFFVPQLRVKQDIVPGMTQYCWFSIFPAAAGRRMDIVCAELCGWGHYNMNGWLFADSRANFERQMKSLAAARFGKQ